MTANEDHPAILQAKKDLETYRSLLAEMKAGGRSGGNKEGMLAVDRTPEYIELLERKIAELAVLVKDKNG
jgi:hypothetical protein